MAQLFRTVIVPVEFSTPPHEEVAVDDAIDLHVRHPLAIGPVTAAALRLATALVAGGDLWLLHATVNPLLRYVEGAFGSEQELEDLRRIARLRSEATLEHAAAEHCGGAQVHVRVQQADPHALIDTALAELAPDAIVLAAGPRSRWHRALSGTTIDGLIRRAPCPVVIVPPGCQTGVKATPTRG